MEMPEMFQSLLDSGGLYLVLGALLCVVIGVGAVMRMFRDASKAEPPDQ
jgi:hypothetical protein